MEKSRGELEKQLAKATAKLEQYQHRGQRLENRIKYYQQGERRKRMHRLITRGRRLRALPRKCAAWARGSFLILWSRSFPCRKLSPW